MKEDKNLDFIPSPYLTGILDKFFLDRRLSPMIQTNRGCPFTCTFCADGHSSQSKVKLFSMDRVKKELEYIADHIDPTLQKTLFITDLNFGMLPRDVEIASFINDIYIMVFLRKILFEIHICLINCFKCKDRHIFILIYC